MDGNLIRRCVGLPKEEKLYLIRQMQNTMMDEREDDGTRFHQLYKAATAVVGGGILSDSKIRSAVIGRKMIIYKMLEEGYTYDFISKCMNRDRSSVRHLRKHMDDALVYPHIYQYEVECWKKFNELL